MGDDQRLDRHHETRQDHPIEQALAGKAQLRQRIGAARAERQHEHRDADRGHRRVQVPLQDGRVRQDEDVSADRRVLRHEVQAGLHDLVFGLQRRDDGPVERERPGEGRQDRQQRQDDVDDAPARPHDGRHPQHLELQDRQDRDGEEQHDRDRGPVAAVIALESLFVDVLHHDIGRVERAALRHQVDLVEDLELQDQLDGQDQRRHRPDQRPGDVAEPREAVGAVEGRGVVDVLRDALQAGDEQQDVEPVGPPDRDEGDRRHGPERVGPHRHGMAEQQPDRVLGNAELRVQHPLPDQEHHRHGQDVGQEEGGEDEALQPAAQARDHHGDAEPEQRRRHHRQQHEIAGVQHRLPEQVVAHQAEVIGPADPLALADQRGVGEAQRHHLVGRVDEQDQVGDHEGPDEGQRGPALSAFADDRHPNRLRSTLRQEPAGGPGRRSGGPRPIAARSATRRASAPRPRPPSSARSRRAAGSWWPRRRWAMRRP